MKAIQVCGHGGPDVLEYTELATPRPGPSEILVRTEAIGVNFIDTYHRSGEYAVDLPFVPGDEASGTVAEVGAEVQEFEAGDRVAWTSPFGSYAEFTAVPASAAVKVPSGLSPEIAASALAQGMTAHYLVHSTYPVAAGDVVLVHAGAGGVGMVLTQFAANLGARVISTVSTDGKEAAARAAGAWEVLRYDDDIPSRVRELTDGDGVPVVFDGVGAATFEASLASLRRRGTLVLYGAASGPVDPVDPQRLNAAGSVYLTRPTIADYLVDREELVRRAEAVFEGLVSGRLSITVGSTYPLSDAGEAHRALESRETTGAVVLVP